MRSLKSFFTLLVLYGLISFVIAAFNTFTVHGVASIGQWVGALGILIGSGRLMPDKNSVMEHIEIQQRFEDIYGDKNEKRDKQKIQLLLPAGAFLFSGLVWLIATQVVLNLY